jgi:RimJ/RimL family protein N-acetyltransferase
VTNLDSEPFETDLIRLSIVTPADREAIAQENVIQSMWDWLPMIGSGTNFDGYFDRVMGEAKTGGLVPFMVRLKADNSFAGLVAFEGISRIHRRLRIGFSWVREDLRASVIGPAIQLALLERAYASRFRRIEYLIPSANARAIASVERLGAQKEGMLRGYFRLANGAWVDAVSLSLLEQDITIAMDRLKQRIRQLQAA